ncbi:MAG: DUF3048 domain-containing protein [Clostridia bacterium]|nr:DUF3048 domain-containing protein [Clostridia bacterium]
MSTKRTVSILLLAAILLLCSCSKTAKKEQDITQQTNTKAQISEKIPVTTPKEDIDNTEAVTYINPLTGVDNVKDLTSKRPITIMINNIHTALPQMGISEADIVYEVLEEGGITRLLCVYNDYSDIAEIGSVRSARDYYIDIADAHDAIFIHAGGSTYAYSDLSRRRTNNIDGLYMSQFYRSAERLKTMSTEHTLMITGKGIDEAIAQKGYRTTTDSPCPISFGWNYSKGSNIANHIEFPFSIGYNSNPYITAFFDYNSETGEYLKGQFGSPHVDGDDNSQLSFKNVITLTCPMNLIAGDALGCIQVHFTGTGYGTYSVDGTQREIIWKKPSRSAAYTLYEADGETPLLAAPGKSYIALVPTGTSITTN